MQSNIDTELEDKIKMLQTLRELLRDPAIAAIAREILSEKPPAPPKPVQPPASRSTPAATVRKARRLRRGGTLVKKALKVVQSSVEPMAAKAVTESLKEQGYKFQASDPNLAVSKALRILAKNGYIEHKPGSHAKAAIQYARLPSLVPAQEHTH